MDKELDGQKCGSSDHLEKNHDSTSNDGVDISHDSEAASHDPHEDGSHDLAAEHMSSSSDVTGNQNEVNMSD